MNRAQFDRLLSEWHQIRMAVLRARGNDYSGHDEVLANFKRMHELCKVWDVRPAERPDDVYAFYILIKFDRIRSLVTQGVSPEGERLEDSILDAQNYLSLYRAYLEERQWDSSSEE